MIYPRIEDTHVYVNRSDPNEWVVLTFPRPTAPEYLIVLGEKIFIRDIERSVAQRRHIIMAAGDRLVIPND